MSDNIQVAIRVRPLNARELHSTENKKCIQLNRGLNSVGISINQSTKTFAYDYVFDQDTCQEDLFEYIGKPIATSVLTGYNGSLFAYGQTGSGKTYTIMGGFMEKNLNMQSLGILPRCLEYIFTHVKRELKKNSGIQYLVKGSFLEIYNETINDLLAPEFQSLQIREDIKKGAYVEALHQDTITSFDDTYRLLEKGIKNRRTAPTSMNDESSRSHSVFTLQIDSKEKKEDVINYKSSYFHLIDLAGSERQKMAETFGERLKEATMINKSLSCLGNVINSLVEIADGKQRHVPYRDSKLTFLLKDSLGGNSKTCIIANISPSLMCYGETLSTLRFAERAKLVKNRAVINEDTTGTVSELREEIKRLKNILKTQQDSPGQFISIDFNERIKNVEGLLEQNLRIRIQSENSLKTELEERDSYINELSQALEKCEQKISNDRKIIKAKDETLKKLQKNEPVEEKKILTGLKEEIEALRKENENHPIAAMLKAENVKLKSEIFSLEKELKESSLSLKARIKENQDFTEKLQQSLRKSLSEREQLHILLEEYSKKSKSDQVQELNSAKRTIQELKKSLELEKNRVVVLENQLNSLTESQLIEETSSSRFSTLNSSGINALNENLFQQEVFQRFLGSIPDPERHQETFQKFMSSLPESERHPEQFLRFLQEIDPGQEEKVKGLEKHVHDLREENKILSKYEVENFKLDEELEKLKRDTMNKDNKIEELQNEIETMIAENEFLSTQFIEFSQQLVNKEKKIKELTEKLSARANKNQIEENMKLRTDLDESTYKKKELEDRLEKMREELEISVNSRREIIDELKNLQNESSSWRTECMELKNKLEDTEKENEKIKENFDELSSETGSGVNSLNQNIKLHSKMKDENNKLRDQNFQLREELRKKNEKVEVLNRKVENFVRGSAAKPDSENAKQDRIDELEEVIRSNQKEFEDISSFIYSLPLEKDLVSEGFGDKLSEAFNQVFQSNSLKQSKIEELTQELDRKNSKLRILENEILVIRQKQGMV